MPFTPSHVAAVLPFARTPLLPAALVVGSVVPDLFYFVPIDVERGFSHSLLGAVTLDLAAGLIVFTLWQLVFRRPAADFAPYWLRARLPSGRTGSTRSARLFVGARLAAGYGALAAASLLVGIATHLAWDTLTHAGWLTSVAPWMTQPLGPLPVVKWMQHGSSVLGAVIVVVWFALWVRRTAVVEPEPGRLTRAGRVLGWVAVLLPALALGLWYWIRGIGWGVSPVDADLVFRTVRLCIGGAGLAAIVVCLAWWALRRRVRVRAN